MLDGDCRGKLEFSSKPMCVHRALLWLTVQETTILTALVPLIHLGMVFVGTPYGQNPQLLVTDGIGGSPYGPGTLAGTDGSRQPVEAELTTARNLGSRVARVASRLKDLRVSRAAAP
jgi:NAD(P)H dehydrogenase (quinone)